MKEENAQKVYRFLRGRQIAHMSYELFRIVGTDESVLEFVDHVNITLRGDDVQGFDTK